MIYSSPGARLSSDNVVLPDSTDPGVSLLSGEPAGPYRYSYRMMPEEVGLHITKADSVDIGFTWRFAGAPGGPADVKGFDPYW